jgi:hypothetical protein
VSPRPFPQSSRGIATSPVTIRLPRRTEGSCAITVTRRVRGDSTPSRSAISLPPFLELLVMPRARYPPSLPGPAHMDPISPNRPNYRCDLSRAS